MQSFDDALVFATSWALSLLSFTLVAFAGCLIAAASTIAGWAQAVNRFQTEIMRRLWSRGLDPAELTSPRQCTFGPDRQDGVNGVYTAPADLVKVPAMPNPYQRGSRSSVVEPFPRPDGKAATPIDYVVAYSVVAVSMLGPVMILLVSGNWG
jgi:hypothetical protein